MLLFLEDNGGNADYKVIKKTNICIWSGEVGMGSVEGRRETTISRGSQHKIVSKIFLEIP